MAEEHKSENFRPLRSFTRLLVGGILLGSELLENQLRDWEGIAGDAESDVNITQADDPIPETLPAPQVGAPPKGNELEVRYALIGLIFEGEEKLEEALGGINRIVRRADRFIDPMMKPIKKIGTSRPVQGGLDQLTNRGQSAVDRWISRGRKEESYSRELTQKAATSTIDQSIDYMADNEAITDLIQTQGVSLAEQILELVRSISFSADYFFEGMVRYILRRRPRYLLPPPSTDVMDQATWTLLEFRHEDQ